MDHEYKVYEVKYLKSPMTKAIVEEETGKIKAIPDLKISSIGVVSSSGFFDILPDIDMISGQDLYTQSF